MAKILICDDETDTRNLVKTLLKREGHSVDGAKDGEDCLKKVRKKKYDLLLLDIMMPGLSFKEVIKKMEKIKTSENTKISLFSIVQYPEAERKKLMEQKNVVEYIQKPISNEELIAAVEGIFLV